MEKYGTDMLRNLIEEETTLMRKIASLMTSADKTASAQQLSKIENELQYIRNKITEIQVGNTLQ